MKKAVYFFCSDLSKDYAAPRIFNALEKTLNPEDTEIIIDDLPVKHLEDGAGNIFHFVRTHQVISHNYGKYLPILNKYFAGFDFAGLVNWHEGAEAEDRIFCAHTTGDVTSGCFGRANPLYMRNLFLEIEKNRKQLGFEDFKTVTEATHWSGIIYNRLQSPELITKYAVPLVDIEIGSIESSWANEAAAEVIARSLTGVFNSQQEVKSILAVGGTHFTGVYAQAVLNRDYPIGISHILSNFFLEQGKYESQEGFGKLERCVETIIGGIDGIAFHKKLSSPIKNQCRRLGEKIGVPVFNKNLLKNPPGLPIMMDIRK
jgi:D-tyrosyl-tRNA(Tyr) deacylase